MEYMLLADGSVRVCEPMLTVDIVRVAMLKHGGVAYYWHDTAGWLHITIDSPWGSGTTTKDVPDVIKLAVMLE